MLHHSQILTFDWKLIQFLSEFVIFCGYRKFKFHISIRGFMKKSIFSAFFLFFTFFVFCQDEPQNSKLLKFKFHKGDKSRILSTVNEDVYLNGMLNHKSVILNRISSEVTDVLPDGSGTCSAIFMTSESATTGNGVFAENYTWGEEYKSIFTRDTTGKYKIDDIYFMPTVRDVPKFPEYPVKPGDSWQAEGHEAHDMRRTFNIQKPFKVPFVADYEYVGDITDENGKTLSKITIFYKLYFESPLQGSYNQNYGNLPHITKGYSNQTVFWDNECGTIDHYSEEFRIMIETFLGDQILFTGTAHAEVTEFERVNTKENREKISETLSNLGIENVDVKENEKGLTISIENIQFLPDSSELIPAEKEKLARIAEILKGFDNDLLITGHCANRGTLRNQQLISEQRAASVARYLSELKVRDPKCIFTQGKGASEPVASNATESGRARNRRVEITIMDE